MSNWNIHSLATSSLKEPSQMLVSWSQLLFNFMTYSDFQNSIANFKKSSWIHIMWLFKGSFFILSYLMGVHWGDDSKNGNYQSILKTVPCQIFISRNLTETSLWINVIISTNVIWKYVTQDIYSSHKKCVSCILFRLLLANDETALRMEPPLYHRLKTGKKEVWYMNP